MMRAFVSSELDEVDIESGQPFLAETLRDQSKRLSRIQSSKTDLHNLNAVQPDPPEEISVENESSGIKYWAHEVEMAKDHGGDYSRRCMVALRAAMGAFTVFSVLVFPHQQVLGAVWIGNIFMHSNIKDSFGASVISVKGFSLSIILTTCFAWPVAYLLGRLSTTEASICLPFVVFIMSFFIMSCPQLSARNLMVLVLYVVVAAPVRDEIEWWGPFGYVGTYLVGLSVAVLVNAVTFNFALRKTHRLLSSLERDYTMMFLQCKVYSEKTATSPDAARAAIASIEMLQTRISVTAKSLKTQLPATKVELSLLCNAEAADDLESWVTQTEKLLPALKSIKTALTQRVIGEEHTMYSDYLREAKVVFNEEVGPSRDRMVDAMISAVAVCHAWADPSAHRTVLPDVEGELTASIRECRAAFHLAIAKGAERLGENPQTNVPIFAHLTRRMTAFNAMFDLADNLCDYLHEHSWEKEEDAQHRRPHNGAIDHVVNSVVSTVAFCEKKWLWYNPDSFRLALKLSVGMVFASLFVSVPFLWKISDPFGVWPGLTVASVNLATTGSSFNKASDRLFGTLLAAAYALLVSDFFPGNKDYVKVPAIAFFTYFVIYLRNDAHAYKFTYAATSIGSMLYGSVKNDFNIATYIPKRIELIFVGVVIFSFVELLLFPRSSRRIVESVGFQYFLSIRDYLQQAARCAKRMEDHVKASSKHSSYDEALFEETTDPFQLLKLADLHSKLKKHSAQFKKELQSGLDEPHVGLSLTLHPESFRGLAAAFGDCEVQALLLVKGLKKVAHYYQEEGHPIREMKWPQVHAQFLHDASERSQHVCEWLKTAYPDGRLRAQQGNCVTAVFAAASFRGFEQVRLATISQWSNNYLEFIQEKGLDQSDPLAVMTLGVITTIILEICRHLETTGKRLETIAHNFPCKKS